MPKSVAAPTGNPPVKRAVTSRMKVDPIADPMLDEVRQGASWAFAAAWGRTPQR